MKCKTVFAVICILILSTVLSSTRATTAQSYSYTPGLYPNAYSMPKLHWRITNVTAHAVEFGFGSGTFWRAQAGQLLSFEIQNVAGSELHGVFTIGNLTLPANDSRIAAEVVFSIWPWFPGLVSHLDWNTVDQDATAAAANFYMNGSLDIRTTSTTKTYTYQQGPWGNQNTTLVYDINTGILLAAYTEFFFLNDYHLGIEFISVTQSPTSLTSIVFLWSLTLIVTIIISCIVSSRLRPSRK